MEYVTGFIDTELYDFENIPNIKYDNSSCKAPVILKSELESIGYTVLEPKILDSSDFGVPQKRQRIIFLAYRNGLEPLNFPVPTTKTKISLLDAICDLILKKKFKEKYNPGLSKYQEENIHGRFLHSESSIYNDELSKHTPIVSERFKLFHQGEKGVDLRKRIKSTGIDLTNYKHLLNLCSKKLNLNPTKVIKI